MFVMLICAVLHSTLHSVRDIMRGSLGNEPIQGTLLYGKNENSGHPLTSILHRVCPTQRFGSLVSAEKVEFIYCFCTENYWASPAQDPPVRPHSFRRTRWGGGMFSFTGLTSALRGETNNEYVSRTVHRGCVWVPPRLFRDASMLHTGSLPLGSKRRVKELPRRSPELQSRIWFLCDFLRP